MAAQELARQLEFGYHAGMHHWDLFLTNDEFFARRKARCKRNHSCSPDAEAKLIEGVQRIANDMLAELRRNHPPELWPKLAEHCKAIEEKRIAQIRLFFFHKRGGRLF